MSKWNDLPCPKCKKPIAAAAEVCPFCQTAFSVEEVRARKKMLAQVYILVALVLVLFLGYCSFRGSGDAPETAKSDAVPMTAPAQQSMNGKPTPDLAHIQQEMAPEGTPPAPVTEACLAGDVAICEVNRAQMSRRDWPLAWRGDYQAQRNVAFCLTNGCDGAVQINKTAGCAWRVVILSAAHDTAGDGDVDNLNSSCGSLDLAGRSAADMKARDIFRRIYGRAMP